MKTSHIFGNAGIVLGLILLCSCATERSSQRSLPADVPVNQDAGRGNWLIVTVQLGTGQKLPVIVDTGAGATVLNKSLAPKLGKRLGTHWQRLLGQSHDQRLFMQRLDSIWAAHPC